MPAPLRYNPIGQCLGKHRHATRRDAERQLARGTRHGRRDDRTERLEVYRCVYCDGWHVGRRRLKPKPGAERRRELVESDEE